ncbi:MAG: LacI family DNA-binding transcriptional regulator [Anaerolineales bacterium]|nr:LacI family DNA-binding transcriptional regulator [Anaerolineales bacterium]
MSRSTIYDIAEKAGVAPSTVSRALQDHPRIGIKTKTRVQKLANEMGYVPSAAARSLSTNRSRVLGVIVHRLEDPYLTEVLKGIEDTLQSSRYSLLLAATQRIPEREKETMRAMSERRVDGIIIGSSHIGMKRLRQLDNYGIPSVLINNQEMLEPDTYLVYNDELYAMDKIVQHLSSIGHERIAYLGSSSAGRTNAKRQQGYEVGMRQAGLSVRQEYDLNCVNSQPQAGAQGMRQLLNLEELPTAVVCYNDMMAIGAMQAIHQAGLHVPDDISVTGFDNIDLAGYITPPLTTFHQPRYELGQQAAKMMLYALNEEEATAQPQVSILRGELIVRQSTSPPLKKKQYN